MQAGYNHIIETWIGVLWIVRYLSFVCQPSQPKTEHLGKSSYHLSKRKQFLVYHLPDLRIRKIFNRNWALQGHSAITAQRGGRRRRRLVNNEGESFDDSAGSKQCRYCKHIYKEQFTEQIEASIVKPRNKRYCRFVNKRGCKLCSSVAPANNLIFERDVVVAHYKNTHKNAGTKR
jgi:hypothetical protein